MNVIFGGSHASPSSCAVVSNYAAVRPHMLLQVSLRWAGDANIALAIELPAGGDATRMVPKVSNLHVSAVGRILLAPLLPEIPGFGAAVISLK